MKIYDITLTQFLLLGNLGPLKIGIDREEVLTQLGEPPSWSAKSRKEIAPLWKYGILQIAFSSNRVWYIGLYPEDEVDLPSAFKLAGYFPTDTTTHEEFEEYLMSEEISYHPDLEDPSKDTATIAINSTTHIYFSDSKLVYSIIHRDK
ncbi:MAG: hypothetical protein ABI947_09480 [Chloroflexota bacterium]